MNNFSLNASTRDNIKNEWLCIRTSSYRPLSQPFITRIMLLSFFFFFHSKHQSTYNGCVPSPNHIPTFSLQSIRFQPWALQPISKILLKKQLNYVYWQCHFEHSCTGLTKREFLFVFMCVFPLHKYF